MASTPLSKVLMLSFLALTITSASGTEQHRLKGDYPSPNLPYICKERIRPNIVPWPACCFYAPPCKSRVCPGVGADVIKASTATQLLGGIDIVLDGDEHQTVQALADLTTKRNFISSALVDDLGLRSNVTKLPETDVHSLEIGCHSVTITEFVLLSIATKLRDSVLRDEIFEVVPIMKSEDEELALPNLVVSLNLLSDAGALAINPDIFTPTDTGEM